MSRIGSERKIIMASIFLVFLGLITAVMNGRTDHIYRTGVAIVGLSIPLILPVKVPDPPERLRPFLAPVYNEGTMMILAVFIAVHVSLVNVPFTHYDLFHRDWRNADMISHFLGGLTLWLIITEVLGELSAGWMRVSRREVVVYSFVVFYTLAIGWEVAEKLSEGSITFIHETAANKLRDLVMDTLGALFGLWMLRRKNYPFSLPRE
ncbi:hypothetical protein [Thermococcus camini]|uniref:Uncharacterized protein n=1 Tax=Thermococcus camini TaxID=2016373 RepID=A0A7G2D3T2_9EURY|nr:hypothetical protein [Thermococcus camini]CAD5243157.1 conserved membrane protein of unknown function [Thermococcus camini]